MMRTGLVVTVPSAAVLLLWACAAAQSPSPAVEAFTPCLASGQVTGWAAECTACLESSCAVEGQAFAQDCADYLACSCVDAQATDASALNLCTPKLSEATCAQGLGALETCQQDKCAGPCPTADGGLNVDAAPPRDSAARPGDGALATVIFSCTNGSGTAAECDEDKVSPSAVAMAGQGCTQVGGVPGDGCSAKGLAGCCRLMTTEDCYYDPTAAKTREATCESAGGTWSTSP
jgi:hypothetical protein